MAPSTLILTREGSVGIIWINRPTRRNALVYEMALELIQAFEAFDKDDLVKVVVLTAKPMPHKTFCAGADLVTDPFTNPGTLEAHRDWGGLISLAILRCSKPTIAVVTGHAAGVGVNITFPCDIRVGWKDAKLVLPFSKIGIVPEGCSSFFLPKLLGASRALSIFLTGRVFAANDPVWQGLWLHLEDTPEKTLERGLSLARELADNSPVSMATLKKMVWGTQVGGMSPVEAHLIESRLLFELGEVPDSGEGVKAFLEKRKPIFLRLANQATKDPMPGWTTENGVYIKTKL